MIFLAKILGYLLYELNIDLSNSIPNYILDFVFY